MNLYLKTEELAFVKQAARELGTTQAYVVRLILRKAMGVSVGEAGESDYSRLRRDMSIS